MDAMASGVGCLCSVCYQPFSDESTERVPRILTCGHTYCTECLCRLERFNAVTCPTCKRGTPTGLHRQTLFSSGHPLSSGVESLPKNYVLLDLLANITRTDKSSTSQGSSSTRSESTGKCHKHDEVKKVYCRNDKCLICIYCQVYGEHKGHDCVLAAEAVVEQHQAIEEHMRTLQCKQRELQQAYRRIEDTAVSIKAKEIETVHTVREHFEQLMAAFLQRRQALITRAKVMSAQKIKQLVQQKSALSHILGKCQSAIQDCQSALNCHDCGLFEAWADFDRNVNSVLDLSCNLEPVTLCDLVCSLPREMVGLLSQHGFIRAGCSDGAQQQPATSTGTENVTENTAIQCSPEELVVTGAQAQGVVAGENGREDDQSLGWESAVTATAIQESLVSLAEDVSNLTAAVEEILEADNQSVEGSDQDTVAAGTSVSLSQGESEIAEQESTTSDGDTERVSSGDDAQLLDISMEEWMTSPILHLSMEDERGLRQHIDRDVEGWTRDVAEAQDSQDSDNAELEEGEEEQEDNSAEEEEDCDYLTQTSRQSFEAELSRLLDRAAAIRSDHELPDVVMRSRQQPLVQLSSSETEDDSGPSFLNLQDLQGPVWRSRGTFSLFPGPFSLLFGESQNEEEEEEDEEEEDQSREDYSDDLRRRARLDLIDFEQEPVPLQQTTMHDRHRCRQLCRHASQGSHLPVSQQLPQLLSTPAGSSSIHTVSTRSSSRVQGGTVSSSDHDQDDAELVERQVSQFLGSLSVNANAGATSSSDFELAPESSGSDSDTHVVAHCSLAALTAAANAAERHRRVPRTQGRGKGVPRPWSSKRGVPIGHYFMSERNTYRQYQRSAAVASHEPRSLPIPANSVCGHCPRPAKSRCCNCSRLFCDNCKRYNGIPCANGSVEHIFTAVRLAKSKSRRPMRHAPFCNAAVELPVHEDEEGTDSPSPYAATTVASTSPRRSIHGRNPRRDAHSRSLSPDLSQHVQPSPARPRLWRCDHCTYFNDPHCGCCEACGLSRSRVQGEGMTCSRCTLVNPAGNLWCEACDNRLEEETNKAEDSRGERDDDENPLACAL